MTKIVGYDPNGIRRVWAEDDYEQTAYGFAREEAAAYVARRPDCAPLSDWKFVEAVPIIDARTGKPVTRETVNERFE